MLRRRSRTPHLAGDLRRRAGLVLGATIVLALACTSAESPSRDADSAEDPKTAASQPAPKIAPEGGPAQSPAQSPRIDRSDDKEPDAASVKVCPAQTADYPVPYFNDTLLIRLPKGISEDNFVEVAPNLVKLVHEVESVSCTEGLPGGMILSMVLSAHKDEPDKGLVTLRDEHLKGLGLAHYRASEETIDAEARFYQAVLDGRRSDPEETPTRLLLQIKEAYGTMYTITYETRPEAWNTLKETFRGSASKITLLPT